MTDLGRERGTQRWCEIEREGWRNCVWATHKLDWQRSKEKDIVVAKIDIKGKRKEV